jgi:DNA-directed RNA polymerase beta subunit
LCAVETPEGQSIGIVKNISYMSHITIPTNSCSLYEIILPQIISLDDERVKPSQVFDKVRVFINGAWVGVSDSPSSLTAVFEPLFISSSILQYFIDLFLLLIKLLKFS